MRAPRRWSSCLLVCIASCATEGVREGSDGGGGIPPTSLTADGGSEEDGEAGSGNLDGDADDEGGEAGEGPSFDVGDGDGSEGAAEGTMAAGCKAVDFLFVIDNSASMQDQQASLVAAFPMFMAEIEATLSGDDYHVLVTDTDAWGRCNTANPWQGVDPGSDLCTNYVKQTVFEECDRTRGAGVVHPAGKFATNGLCDPDGDQRYLVSGDSDLPGHFACMATVGTAGDPSERPMDGLVAAVAPEINAAGGCNDGFLRDDAVLVVTFISDDPHYEDSGDPQIWYDAVLAAKANDPAAIVVLGMTPDWPGCQENNGMTRGAHWHEFVDLWGDHGLHGNVCGTADEYVAFFQQAVSVIDGACDDFEPPG